MSSIDMVMSNWPKALPSKWNPEHPPKVKIKPRQSEKTKLKLVGPHTFEDEHGNKQDSDDVQWHCPKCKRQWNEAEYPCECGQESPYEIEKKNTASIVERLDALASEIEKEDPRIALAIDHIADAVEAGAMGKILGGTALILWNLLGNLQAEPSIPSINKIKNKVETHLVDMQNANSKDVVETVFRDLVRDFSDVPAGDLKSKLLDKAKDVREESLKRVKALA